MYYLPIHIESRRVHICKLTKGQNNTSSEFVVSHASRNTFLTLKKGTQLLSEDGTNDDRLVLDHNGENWTSAFKIIFESHDNTLNLVLEELPEKVGILEVDGEDVLEQMDVRYRLKDDGLVLENTATTPRTLACNISYRSFTSYLTFDIVPNTQIVNAVFDFGSEASQIGVMFNDAENIELLNLISLAYDHFYKRKFADTDTTNADFYQYEHGHNHVLLSYFFLRTQEGISNKLGVPFQAGKNSLIKILAKHTDPVFFNNINKNNDMGHFLLPNLKLADVVDFPNIKYDGKNGETKYFDNQEVKDEIFEIIMSQFVHLLLKRIDNYYTTKNPNQKTDIYLRLNLLVPNIYSQHKVFNMLERLNENTSAIFQQDHFKNDFKGIELLTSSESDASFDYKEYEQGRNDRNGASSPDYCLVIDAGKGTTDFSIIECLQNPNRYISSHRSGIAGAGNLMTFAIMEAIVATITNNNPQKSKMFIEEKILKADAYRQLNFFYLIEKIKKSYDSLDEITAEKLLDKENEYLNISFGTLQDLGLRELNDFLKKFTDANKRIMDYYGIIDKSIDSYVKKLMHELENTQEKKFYNIRFAGRAFLFSPLREKLEKQLKKFSRDIDHLERPKEKCLENSLDKRIRISENSNLVGIPVTSKGSVTNRSNFLESIGFSESEEPQNDDFVAASDNFFLSGINLKKEDIKTITISGYQYILENESLLNTQEDTFNLIYTGDAFLVRSADESTKLEIEKSINKKDDDAIRSLFPNIPAGEDIPIIKNNTESSTSRLMRHENIVQKYIKLLQTP
ncbi:MAG: hypothetical protein Aureis2KO_06470 [Aureisphaera sp.]